MRESIVHTAVRIAAEAHEGQTRFSGSPFISHPMRVMAYTAAYGLADDVTLAAAALHDVLEDGDPNEYDHGMLRYHTSAHVADTVRALTRVEGQTYEEYVSGIISAGQDAIIVKLADLKDNMDASEVPFEKLKWHADRVAGVYLPAFSRLSSALQHPSVVTRDA